MTHWEKRIFQNEAMTGTVHSSNPVYSRLTLALLEDSGWYITDFSKAQPLSWGAGAGCQFATKSCMELLADRDSPFCSTPMESGEKVKTSENLSSLTRTIQTTCTADLTSVGSCNLVEYSQDLPEIYQNFKSVAGVEEESVARMGSSVTLADFCPYVQEFTWRGGGSEEGRGTTCDDPDNAPLPDNNYALESYGGRSRCFRQVGRSVRQEYSQCTAGQSVGGEVLHHDQVLVTVRVRLLRLSVF